MKAQILLLIILSIVLSATAQIVLKTGMSNPIIGSAINRGAILEIMLLIAGNPWVIGGLSLYFIGAVVWLFVLAKVDVSMAYPFVGLGFILTMLFGRFLLAESVGLIRIVGTLLVAIGVVLIAQT